MSASATQPKEVLPTFVEELGKFPKATRIAIITPSAVTRMQVSRIMTQPYLRIFASAEESLGWLLGRA